MLISVQVDIIRLYVAASATFRRMGGRAGRGVRGKGRRVRQVKEEGLFVGGLAEWWLVGRC